MSTRILVWTFAVLAVVLVVVPLVGLLGMGGGTMGNGMMGGGMAGMHVFGMLWLILTIIAIAALVALLVGKTKV